MKCLIFILLFQTCVFGQENWYELNYPKSGTGIALGESHLGDRSYWDFISYRDSKKEGWSFVQGMWKTDAAWFLYYQNDTLIKAIGVNKRFDSEGELDLKIALLKGILVSNKSIPRNIIIREYSFKNNKLHGKCIEYDASTGKVSFTLIFKNGIPHGNYTRYQGRTINTFNFEGGIPTDKFFTNITGSDTLAFFQLDINRIPDWEALNTKDFHQPHNFFSHPLDLYSIVINGISPMFIGEFLEKGRIYTTTNYNNGDRIWNHVIVHYEGDFKDTVKNFKNGFLYSDKVTYFYQDNNQLWYTTFMLDGKEVGTQKRYDMKGRLLSEITNDDRGKTIGLEYYILYRSIPYPNYLNKYKTDSIAKKETYRIGAEIEKEIYYNLSNEPILIYLNNLEGLVSKTWEIRTKNDTIYHLVLDENSQFFKKNDIQLLGDFKLIRDTLYYGDSRKIMRIRNLAYFFNSKRDDSTRLLGEQKEFNIDGILKEEGVYYFNVKVGAWKIYEFGQLMKIQYFSKLGEIDSTKQINSIDLVNISNQDEYIDLMIKSVNRKFDFLVLLIIQLLDM